MPRDWVKKSRALSTSCLNLCDGFSNPIPLIEYTENKSKWIQNSCLRSSNTRIYLHYDHTKFRIGDSETTTQAQEKLSGGYREGIVSPTSRADHDSRRPLSITQITDIKMEINSLGSPVKGQTVTKSQAQ